MVPLIDALVTHQVPDEHIWKPERCELLFQREPHSLTLNVFALSPETAQLLDLCQEGLTIGTIIARLEQLLGERELEEDVLAMLGTLQEQHIIGGRP